MTHFSALSALILTQLWAASWQGAIAAILVFSVTMAVRSLPSSLQCWLWRLVSLKMLVVFFCWGAIELPLLPAVPTGTTDLRAPTVVEAAVEISSGSESEPGAIPLNAVGVEQQQGSFGNNLALLLAGAWIIGASWRVEAVYRDWRRSVQLVRDSTPIDNQRICTILADTAVQHGISCPQLRESSILDAPIVVGVAHPQIILPSDAVNGFSNSQVRLLLSHELAHIRRRDLLWNWLGVVSGVLFFFHPFVSNGGTALATSARICLR